MSATLRLLCVMLLPALAACSDSVTPPAGKATPADCLTGENGTPVQVRRVIDGDTVVLHDGRHLRLIGINTPELTEFHERNRRAARAATDALQHWLDQADTLELIMGTDATDRHGRALGHLRAASGDTAALHLIRNGFGAAVAVGLNTRCAEQSMTAENEAKAAHRGLWSSQTNNQTNSPADPFAAPDADAQTPVELAGFHIIRGQVEALEGRHGRRGFRLDNGLRVYPGRSWPDNARLDDLAGTRVEVRGWISQRHGTPSLTLHHPLNLQRLAH